MQSKQNIHTPNRHRQLNKASYLHGPIIYWMTRDHRVEDHWGLHYAQTLAQQHSTYVQVVFCLRRNLEQYSGTARMLEFMIDGLKEVEKKLHSLNIPFTFLLGDPSLEIRQFIESTQAGAVIVDFSPLRINRHWNDQLAQTVPPIPVVEVDSHNIIPCWVASPKLEFAAYTFRPKVHKLLPHYLTEFPSLHQQEYAKQLPKNNWIKIRQSIEVDESVSKVNWVKSGEKAGRTMLFDFIDTRLDHYSDLRNDPNQDAQSRLSPYLHFGQVSAQRVALEVQKADSSAKNKETFLEELIVRKELSDNYCYYNREYDSFKGLADWAQQTLTLHSNDSRADTYSLTEFEHAQTHEALWNAAQTEMVKTGKMHGYMRMYWAKKILEWTENPEQAMKYAIYLNDKYSLDGRDPNGYTGIAWSIGGVHDRAWFERPIFGKVRYMNANGAKRKFDVEQYISRNLST